MGTFALPSSGSAKAVRRHPLVVEDLGQVAAATVGKEHDNKCVGAFALGDFECRDDSHAARSTDQQAFFTGETTRHLEGVRIRHSDDLVRDGRIVGGGPEIFADAFDQVRATGAAGVDGTFGIDADNLDGAPDTSFR